MYFLPLFLIIKILCTEEKCNFHDLLGTIFSKGIYTMSKNERKIEILTALKLMHICACIEIMDKAKNEEEISDSSEKELMKKVKKFENELKTLIERVFEGLNKSNIAFKLQVYRKDIDKLVEEHRVYEDVAMFKQLNDAFKIPIELIVKSLNLNTFYDEIYSKFIYGIFDEKTAEQIKIQIEKMRFLTRKTHFEEKDLYRLIDKIKKGLNY